jgi:formate--tetrahydrofolate ligase
MHGGVEKNDLGKKNVSAVKKGCDNLQRHIKNIKSFGMPVVVAINKFITDTDEELNAVRSTAKKMGAEAIICSHWSDGSAGTEDLAKHVIKLVDGGKAKFKPLYPDNMALVEKVRTVAKNIYGAKDISFDAKVARQFEELQEAGYGHFPVCMAKTQYSFSTNPDLKGAPSGHVVLVRELRLSAGAEFVIVITGEIMTMPGLPRVPSADSIHLNKNGRIEGLF